MRHPLSVRPRPIVGLLAALGVFLAAAAWANPGTRPAPAVPLHEEEISSGQASPLPETEADAPVAAGVAGAARFRDGDSRGYEGPLAWLFGGSGPRASLRPAIERVARDAERRPAAVAESTRPSKAPAARAGGGGFGAGGHIARPHRMPSLEIL